MAAFYETELGWLRIDSDGESVTGLRFVECPEMSCPDSLCDAAAAQVREYLAGERREFTLPIQPKGSPFALSVWRALREIPYGQTVSYGDIACRIGSPKAARAVGAACRNNPIWLAIPCHRVVGKNGCLTGFAGGIDRKARLLHLEGIDYEDQV